jgi:cytochrome c oxidase subunit 3
MAHAKNHDYHILPLRSGRFRSGRLRMLFGAVLWLHGNGPWLFLIGFAGVLYVMFGWWADVVDESQQGDHTPVVRIGLRYGFIMFIMSEVMFFAAWFWSFFKHAMYPMGPRGPSPATASGRRRDRDLRPLAPAADQHADPAVSGAR